MNNDDERDHAEEAHNARLLESGDGEAPELEHVPLVALLRGEPQVPPDVVVDLLERLQAATRRVTQFGGWPPVSDLIRVLREYFAEYGLEIDMNIAEELGRPRGSERPEPDDDEYRYSENRSE